MQFVYGFTFIITGTEPELPLVFIRPAEPYKMGLDALFYQPFSTGFLFLSFACLPVIIFADLFPIR